ncbi:proton-conducting transporter membrane subunit [Bradyrhizobium sp. SSUT18]|uniref:complex I subunit 5 family protein n=1 Tax=Bradyrhizobium sp. SSUT18 TaxID=3040602 RepID=UPI00244B51C7|nr:proton-conducting transporter membrane subunit [Bradyrhizobium sp. SSUT18]MDH2401324.1 proton-conducting transporter membrane subunit [Bradyrhizobium sp. SSUT18]
MAAPIGGGSARGRTVCGDARGDLGRDLRGRRLAHADFKDTATRAPFAFWILLLAIWAALDTIFVGGDLFTLYVALELLTFAAVPLVSLEGRPDTLRAAIRYLLFALLGSVLYLLGTALLYGCYGTLYIALLSHRIQAEPASFLAAALMTAGLLAKTALFPLHLWLPPAHAGAPAAASAILSGLVVKGSFFIIVRLWFQVMPALPGLPATQLLAALGAAAIMFGSVLALRQERLKLLIAYSTVAQLGYLFLMFPLAFDASGRLEDGNALSGGLLQAVSHATAKAAMFMAAGSIYARLGHDRLTDLHGLVRTMPLSVLAFCSRRHRVGRRTAERCVAGKRAVASCRSRKGAVVVGGRARGGRNVYSGLRHLGLGSRAGAYGRADCIDRSGTTRPEHGAACAGPLLVIARLVALGSLSSCPARFDVRYLCGRDSHQNILLRPGWRGVGGSGRSLAASACLFDALEDCRRHTRSISTQLP